MKENPDADHDELKSSTDTFRCSKYLDAQKELPRGLPLNSRGAMLQLFEQHLYAKKVEQVCFGKNKVYLCADSEGKNYNLDTGPETDKPIFVTVFSSVELLLNLLHKHQSGQDIHIMIYASYLVSTIRNCGYIPVKVDTITQTGHTVAYAPLHKGAWICSQICCGCSVTSMEAVVNH
jgi:hypothetical protein